ncbi:MAG: glycosyltransferase [Candidatus Liptonbacteria bacterium]
MRILFACLENDKYDPQRGKSFEYNNFYLQLKTMPHTVEYFPFDRILEVGRERFNQELLAKVEEFQPDLLFAFMYTDELLPETLEKIKEKTTSVAWFSDDSWRYWNYSRAWAKYFTWAVTTYSWMPEPYKKHGQPNVIRSQWGANIDVYKPGPVPDAGRPGVTFVGGWSSQRGKIVEKIKRAGIPVEVFGGGWPEVRFTRPGQPVQGGRVSTEEMVRLFGESKISLALNPPPGFWNKDSLGRIFFRRSLNKIVPDHNLYSNMRSFFGRGMPQVKGRHFEIPACGGFLLTARADDLENYFRPGEEMVFYEDDGDYIEKIKYYLEHDEEREKIARAGYDRVRRDHSYVGRLNDIFGKIGGGTPNLHKSDNGNSIELLS